MSQPHDIPRLLSVKTPFDEGAPYRRVLALAGTFPKIITLCGSTRFLLSFHKANRDLTLQGHIVISVGTFGHAEKTVDMSEESQVKVALDELHKRKIDLSDMIFVVNDLRLKCQTCGVWYEWDEAQAWWFSACGCIPHGMMLPYVGSSTKSEIEYARKNGKEVLYLNPPETPEK